jgi:hypothetical protein
LVLKQRFVELAAAACSVMFLPDWLELLLRTNGALA